MKEQILNEHKSVRKAVGRLASKSLMNLVREALLKLGDEDRSAEDVLFTAEGAKAKRDITDIVVKLLKCDKVCPECRKDPCECEDKKDLQEGLVGEALHGPFEIETFFKMARDIGIDKLSDLEKFLKNEAEPGETEWETMLRYRASLGDGFKKISESLDDEEDEIGYMVVFGNDPDNFDEVRDFSKVFDTEEEAVQFVKDELALSEYRFAIVDEEEPSGSGRTFTVNPQGEVEEVTDNYWKYSYTDYEDEDTDYEDDYYIVSELDNEGDPIEELKQFTEKDSAIKYADSLNIPACVQYIYYDEEVEREEDDIIYYNKKAREMRLSESLDKKTYRNSKDRHCKCKKSKIEAVEKGDKCVICGKEIKGYGNNPAPVKNSGRCCDDCNKKVVIPARIKAVGAGKLNESKIKKYPQRALAQLKKLLPHDWDYGMSDAKGEEIVLELFSKAAEEVAGEKVEDISPSLQDGRGRVTVYFSNGSVGSWDFEMEQDAAFKAVEDAGDWQDVYDSLVKFVKDNMQIEYELDESVTKKCANEEFKESDGAVEAKEEPKVLPELKESCSDCNEDINLSKYPLKDLRALQQYLCTKPSFKGDLMSLKGGDTLNDLMWEAVGEVFGEGASIEPNGINDVYVYVEDDPSGYYAWTTNSESQALIPSLKAAKSWEDVYKAFLEFLNDFPEWRENSFYSDEEEELDESVGKREDRHCRCKKGKSKFRRDDFKFDDDFYGECVHKDCDEDDDEVEMIFDDDPTISY